MLQERKLSMSFADQVAEQTANVDFDANRYAVKLETSEGSITLDLMPEYAPEHCRNMIGLARAGFYNGLIFHRIIPGFMIQGGCPQGTGTGNPGYSVNAEFNDLPHEPGVLSMARSQDPNSAGSQFFVCLDKHTHLDGSYTAFGKTADDDSLAVVKQIGSVATDGGDRPLEDVLIHSAEVVETAK